MEEFTVSATASEAGERVAAAGDVEPAAANHPLAWIAGFGFVSALQLMLMGLLAEMTVRIYHESQHKPTYVVRQVLNRREEPPIVRHIRLHR